MNMTKTGAFFLSLEPFATKPKQEVTLVLAIISFRCPAIY